MLQCFFSILSIFVNLLNLVNRVNLANLVNLVNLVKRVNRSILLLFIIDGQALEDEGLDFNTFVAQIRTKHAGRCRVDLYVKTFSKPPKVPDL